MVSTRFGHALVSSGPATTDPNGSNWRTRREWIFDFEYQIYLIATQGQNEESEGSGIQPERWSSFR